MPRVAPGLRGCWGDTQDYVGNITTNVEFDCVYGDIIVVYMGTSDYMHRAQGLPVWTLGSGEAFVERGAVYGFSTWANCYTWTARTTFTGRAKVSVAVSGGNANANSSAIRAQVWTGSDGVGAQAALRQAGAPQIGITTQQDYSAVAFVGVDWNAANGTLTVVNGTTVDRYLNQTWAEFVFAYNANAGVKGAKTVGSSTPTNWKPSMAAVEILGKFQDTTPPSVVSSLTATVVGSSQVRVDWGPATDDIGVIGYYVVEITDPVTNAYTLVGSVPASSPLTFTVSGLAPESTHTYAVIPTDAAGNLGTSGAPMRTVTTAPAVIPVNKGFVGVNKPTLRVGTTLVSKLYVGTDQVWP